jgi:hypothetical protein
MREINRRLGVWVNLVQNTIKMAFNPKRDTLSAGAVLLLGTLLGPRRPGRRGGFRPGVSGRQTVHTPEPNAKGIDSWPSERKKQKPY